MADPKSILTIAIGKIGPKEDDKHEASESGIVELVERVFTTRNLVHFAHWNTKSFAAHSAFGELYDGIVDEVDDIVETYQGEFGLVKGFCTDEAEACDDVVKCIKDDATWLKANRSKVANGSTVIENMLDTLAALYNKVIYKLENLK